MSASVSSSVVRAVGALLAALVLAAPASAHEFWIEADLYAAEPGERVDARLRIGERMSGTELSHITVRYESFTVTTPEGTRDVEGNEGDIPALSYVATTPGLHVIAYHSIPSRLRYQSWAKFTKFLDYEGLLGIAEAHRARGLPRVGFIEDYVRYAKSLVQVGPARPADADRALGLKLELVAGANPYAPGTTTLPVTLLLDGEPLAATQVSAFRRADPVERTLYTTDAAGRAEIDLARPGEYLLNAVHIEPIERGETVWLSHWASLTFSVGTP